MNFESIIKELGRENRLLILESLREDKTPSEIKKELKALGIIKSYITVSRYLDSLENSGLIERDKGIFRITSAGNLTLTLMKRFNLYLKTLTRYKEFFSGHSLEEISQPIIEDFYILEKGKLIKDPFSLSLIILKKVKKASRIRIAVPEVDMEFLEYIKRVEDLVIFAGNSWEKNGEKLRIPLGLLIVDKNFACVFFPHKDGSLDMTSAFISGDINFIEWAERIFQSYQKEGFQPYKVPQAP